METNILTTVLLPVALVVIMLGMGLDLVLDDFKRAVVYPKAIVIGIISKMVFLPLIAFALAVMFKLPGELAVGLMILAACPGGSTSNLIANLVKGDVALCLTLTAITSLIAILTIPLIANLSLTYFMGSEAATSFPVIKSTLQIVLVTFIPVSIGMLIKKFVPKVSDIAKKPIKILSVLFLIFVVTMSIIDNRADIVNFVVKAGPAAFVLNIAALSVGALASVIFKLSTAQRRAVTTSNGIQNSVLALTLISMVGSAEMSIPAAIYSIIMFVTAGFIVATVLIRDKKLLAKLEAKTQ